MPKQHKKKVYALIPARGGSKGIPRKNLISIGGFPLIAYTVIAARLTPSFDRVIVSTDDPEIAQIAKKFGAEVPFLRPKEFARDDSPDREFILHALDWFKDTEDSIPDYIAHLRPTTPLRIPALLHEATKKMLAHTEATSLRSAHEVRDLPFKNFRIEGDYFEGLFPHDPRPEYYNLPRQVFPKTYHVNGYIDIMKSNFMLAGQSLHGNKILPFITEETEDIDTPKNRERVSEELGAEKWEIYEYLKKHFS